MGLEIKSPTIRAVIFGWRFFIQIWCSRGIVSIKYSMDQRGVMMLDVAVRTSQPMTHSAHPEIINTSILNGPSSIVLSS